jgi:hypothetical protein
MKEFYCALEGQYQPNPFHNARHACDVAHSLLFLFDNTTLKSHITKLELNAALIAAFSHDVAHFGVNNRFLALTNHRLAFRYND